MAHLSTTQQFADGIVKLHDELLWRIFLLNADLSEEIVVDRSKWLASLRQQDPAWSANGLTVTRHTSQVCRSWRSLILNSTAIWGRLIDLHILGHSSQTWRDEVLRRTGDAPLDIKGELLGMSPTRTPLFSLIVEHHWARIRSLDITIFGVPWISKDAWGFLKQPAPNMQIFSIHIYDGYADQPTFFSEPDMGLFANSAASLRELRITRITFDPNASWLAHLRRLDLTSPFPLHRLFEVLKNTPGLERLIIRGEIIDNPESEENSQVILPRLRNIDITHKLKTCLAILEHIVPPSGCGLTMFVPTTDLEQDVPLSSAEMKRLRLTVSRFSKAYFSAWKATQVDLEIGARIFRFQSGASEEMKLPPISAPEFSIRLENSNGFPREASLFSILGDLAGNSFVNVSKLTIDISPPILYPVDSQFTSFIVSFASVDEIQATSYALGLLVDMPHSAVQDGASDLAGVLPQLRTVVIRSQFDQPSILKFLEWKRQVGGTPIEVLDLTKVRIDHADEVADVVGSFPGLKVLRGPTQAQRGQDMQAWARQVLKK